MLFLTLVFSETRAGEKPFARPFTVVLTNRPDTLNPHATVSLEGHVICKQVYQAPLSRNFDGSYSPSVIRHWEFSPDKTRLNIEIDRAAKFSNGAAVTAADLEKSLVRGVLFRNNEEIMQIVGSEAVRAEGDRLKGFSIRSEREAVLRFKSPAPRFLGLLSELNTAITLRTGGSELLGTGPYQVASVTRSETKIEAVALNINPHAARPSPGPSGAVVKFGAPEASADLSTFGTSTQGRFLEYLDAEVEFIGFNLHQAMLRDFSTRLNFYRALRAGLDPAVKLPGTMVPKGLIGYDPSKTVRPRSADGKAAGVANNKVTVSYYISGLKQWAETVCSALMKSGIGCTVKEHKLSDVLVPGYRRANIDIFVAHLKPSIPSVEDLFQAFQSKNKINFFSTTSLPAVAARLDRHIARLNTDASLTPESRLAIYREIDRLITDELIAIPLSYGRQQKVYLSNRVSLPSLGVMGLLDLDLSQIRITTND